MAKAVINLQKESGSIVKISPVDGIRIYFNKDIIKTKEGKL